jgi:hypothetical protein
MAYFSNGCEGEVFDNECADCVLGEEACPIAFVQSFYNYDACNNPIATDILNHLVEQKKDYTYVGCKMKPFLDKFKDKKC